MWETSQGQMVKLPAGSLLLSFLPRHTILRDRPFTPGMLDLGGQPQSHS